MRQLRLARWLIALIVILALAVPAAAMHRDGAAHAALALQPAEAAGQAGTVTALRNRSGVGVQRQGESAWLPVALGDALYSGDTLRTGGDSGVQIVLTPGGGEKDTVDVHPDTTVTMPVAPETAGGRSAVRLTTGILNVRARRASDTQGPDYCTATFCTVTQGARVTISYDGVKTHALVIVVDGAVEIRTGDGQAVPMSGGQMLEWDGNLIRKAIPLSRSLAQSFETGSAFYDERPFPVREVAVAALIAGALLAGVLVIRQRRRNE